MKHKKYEAIHFAGITWDSNSNQSNLELSKNLMIFLETQVRIFLPLSPDFPVPWRFFISTMIDRHYNSGEIRAFSTLTLTLLTYRVYVYPSRAITRDGLPIDYIRVYIKSS